MDILTSERKKYGADLVENFCMWAQNGNKVKTVFALSEFRNKGLSTQQIIDELTKVIPRWEDVLIMKLISQKHLNIDVSLPRAPKDLRKAIADSPQFELEGDTISLNATIVKNQKGHLYKTKKKKFQSFNIPHTLLRYPNEMTYDLILVPSKEITYSDLLENKFQKIKNAHDKMIMHRTINVFNDLTLEASRSDLCTLKNYEIYQQVYRDTKKVIVTAIEQKEKEYEIVRNSDESIKEKLHKFNQIETNYNGIDGLDGNDAKINSWTSFVRQRLSYDSALIELAVIDLLKGYTKCWVEEAIKKHDKMFKSKNK
jgi:hypothetical protein